MDASFCWPSLLETWVMKSKHDKKLSSTEIKGELWVVLCKVRGLAELVSMASGEPPMSEVAYKGLSYILLDIADQIDAITATDD